jgi:hypothetical protein
MRIEDFGVSEECLTELKRVGVMDVEDIAQFFEQIAIAQPTFEAGWLKYWDEIVNQLKVLGYWAERMGQTWPSN